MTFGSSPTARCATRMTGTPSSSQTTVLGEWRPPPSVAIFQFRSSFSEQADHPAPRWDLRPCRAFPGWRILVATPERGDVRGTAWRQGGVQRAQRPLIPPRRPRPHEETGPARGQGRPAHWSRRCRCTAQLLDAAVAQRGPCRHAPDQAQRARCAAAQPRASSTRASRPPRTPMRSRSRSPARSRYDVALLELSEVMGIETDLRRFEQPRQERARLEEALRDRWVTSRDEPPTPAEAHQVPVASLRDSWLDRSLMRAAKVAAWVRRSMPSLASRLET